MFSQGQTEDIVVLLAAFWLPWEKWSVMRKGLRRRGGIYTPIFIASYLSHFMLV